MLRHMPFTQLYYEERSVTYTHMHILDSRDLGYMSKIRATLNALKRDTFLMVLLSLVRTVASSLDSRVQENSN